MHCKDYLRETAEIAFEMDSVVLEAMATEIHKIRENKGRLFIIGMGGSLANAIHMAADMRKLCGVDAHSPSNIAELTARANDEGLDTIFTGWLSDIDASDGLMVLSVGGGTALISRSITDAVKLAKAMHATILGVVGPKGGITHELGNCVLRIPVSNSQRLTPHTEAFQAVAWHCLVSHPLLQRNKTTW